MQDGAAGPHPTKAQDPKQSDLHLPSKRTFQFTDEDRRFMAMAMSLAKKGRGKVEPNPMVGCVIVKRGRIVSTGWHRRFGGAHAEVNALREAGRKAAGATVYVTLEPCCHFGKTPPCTDALVDAKVGRVVAACRDPFPKVSGGGFSALRKAGIQTEYGLMQAEAQELNAPFLTLLERHRPYVIAKWAQSLDGKIATTSGDSKWISGSGARRIVHQLRGYVDGIIVGARTARLDDPELTARDVRPKRIASRIVFDSQLKISNTANVVQTARQVPTIIMTTTSAAREHATRRCSLENKGVKIIACRSSAGRVSPSAALRHLGSMGMTNVLLEGGGELIGAFYDAGLIDEAHVFTAPLIIGGDGKTGCHGTGVKRVRDSLRGCVRKHRMIDGDQYVIVRFTNPQS